jgi:hypothetical protein
MAGNLTPNPIRQLELDREMTVGPGSLEVPGVISQTRAHCVGGHCFLDCATTVVVIIWLNPNPRNVDPFPHGLDHDTFEGAFIPQTPVNSQAKPPTTTATTYTSTLLFLVGSSTVIHGPIDLFLKEVEQLALSILGTMHMLQSTKINKMEIITM